MSTAKALLPRTRRWMDYLVEEDQFPRLSLALQTIVGLAAFGVAERPFTQCAKLPAEMYYRPVMIFSALRYTAPIAVLVLALLVLIFGHRRLRWEEFELGRHVRPLAFTVCAAIALAYSLYDYNFFFDRWHVFDRGLLVLLAALVWRHPAFLGLFLLQAFVVTGQFSFPLRYSWTDKMLLYQVLILLYTFIVLKLALRKIGFAPFLAACLCVVGIFYLRPAIGKIEFGWLAHNDQANILLAAAYQNAWLAFADQSSIDRCYALVDSFGYWLMAVTLIFEVLILFCLANPKLAAALLSGMVLIHLGIFGTTGILFWKWIVLDVALVALVLLLPRTTSRRIFNLPNMALGAVMMLGLQLVYRQPVKLAWYDAPMSTHFHIEAVGQSGRVYQVPPYKLAPFDLPFAQGRFYFLAERPQVVNCFGSMFDFEGYRAVGTCRDAEDLAHLRAQFGIPRHDPERAVWYDELLKRYLAHELAHRGGSFLPRALKPPHHIWTYAQRGSGQEVYEGQEPILRVRVRLSEALLRNGRPRVVFDQIVRQFDVAPASPIPLDERHDEIRTALARERMRR